MTSKSSPKASAPTSHSTPQPERLTVSGSSGYQFLLRVIEAGRAHYTVPASYNIMHLSPTFNSVEMVLEPEASTA